MSVFWLSFVDTDKPRGEHFLGVLLTESGDSKGAIEKAKELGINPGGEILVAKLDDLVVSQFGNEKISKLMDRLLSFQNLEEAGLIPKTIEELKSKG